MILYYIVRRIIEIKKKKKKEKKKLERRNIQTRKGKERKCVISVERARLSVCLFVCRTFDRRSYNQSQLEGFPRKRRKGWGEGEGGGRGRGRRNPSL